MSLERARYRTTVLFGKEHRQRVVEPDRFAAIVKTLVDTVAPAHGQLQVRGRIDGPRAKNVAPRAGAWTRASLSRWQTSLAAGRFRTLELFGPQWSSHQVPLVYASLRKFWGYGPGGHTERTLHGAENNITVAVAHAVSQDQGEWVDECVRTLGTLIDAFYGFAEESVHWGKPFAPGSQSYTYTIDMRAHDIAEGAYRGGKYSMAEYVSGVYWGNLFSESHIRGKPSAVLSEQTETTFQVGDSATFLRFQRDPEHDDQLRGEAESLFRLVPKT